VSTRERVEQYEQCAPVARIRPHTSAYVNIYVSIRQHTSAYASIRQCVAALCSRPFSLFFPLTIDLSIFYLIIYQPIYSKVPALLLKVPAIKIPAIKLPALSYSGTCSVYLLSNYLSTYLY
jgi:hypothetical protein